MGRDTSRGDTWCRHRTPFTAEYGPCKKGVNWRQFQTPDVPYFGLDDMPCIGRTKATRARCKCYEAHTPEELAERRKRVAEKIAKALAAIPSPESLP